MPSASRKTEGEDIHKGQNTTGIVWYSLTGVSPEAEAFLFAFPSLL